MSDFAHGRYGSVHNTFLLFPILLLHVASTSAQAWYGSSIDTGNGLSQLPSILGMGFGSFPPPNTSSLSSWQTSFTNPNASGFQAFPSLNISSTNGSAWLLRTAISQTYSTDAGGGSFTDQSVWLDLPEGVNLQASSINQTICSASIFAAGLQGSRQKVSSSQTSRTNGGCDDLWGNSCSEALKQAIIDSSQLENIFPSDLCRSMRLPAVGNMPISCGKIFGNDMVSATAPIGGPNSNITGFVQQNSTLGSFWNRYDGRSGPAKNNTFLHQLVDSVFPVFIFTVPNKLGSSGIAQQDLQSQVQVTMACPVLDQVRDISGSISTISRPMAHSIPSLLITTIILSNYLQSVF